jgi:phosphate transport system permease protein
MTTLKLRARDSVPVLFTSMGLLLILGMLVLMLWILLARGLMAFWPHDIQRLEMADGTVVLGEVWEAFDTPEGARLRVRTGNRDLWGQDFVQLRTDEVKARSLPTGTVLIERHDQGVFIGLLEGLGGPDGTRPASGDGFRAELESALALAGDHRHRQERTLDDLHTLAGRLERERDPESPRARALQEQYSNLELRLDSLVQAGQTRLLGVSAVDGGSLELPLVDVVRLVRNNELGTGGRLLVYGSRLWEFLSAEPRESNTAGGVLPAIFGTVLMVMLMSVAVVPIGVMAAVYLNDYARQGFLVQAIRLAVNNLAGVPSIVYGIFGLGFFIYFVGGGLDSLFFKDSLPAPTFGTGGILWASLTLALLTLPVVVVATTEGLQSVSQTTRMAALALGATRWQMIRQVVLPNAMPGILTGLILAISRAAGEVAPLMITGVVKLAPSLALDGEAPFLHLDRKFMHLGFHIYDLGFQSPNVEAALPMLFSTALLLILVVLALNLAAILLRTHLRKRYRQAAF